MRRRVHAHDEINLLLVEQAAGLVDRDLRLGLRVGGDGLDLVALDAALLVDHVDGDLRADGGGLRAAGRERAGEVVDHADANRVGGRSEEHTSELQSLMRISYAVFLLKKKNQ